MSVHISPKVILIIHTLADSSEENNLEHFNLNCFAAGSSLNSPSEKLSEF